MGLDQSLGNLELLEVVLRYVASFEAFLESQPVCQIGSFGLSKP